MKLLADESVDGPIVARLRDDGHEVPSIAEDSPDCRTSEFWPAPTKKESS